MTMCAVLTMVSLANFINVTMKSSLPEKNEKINTLKHHTLMVLYRYYKRVQEGITLPLIREEHA